MRNKLYIALLSTYRILHLEQNEKQYKLKYGRKNMHMYCPHSCNTPLGWFTVDEL